MMLKINTLKALLFFSIFLAFACQKDDKNSVTESEISITKNENYGAIMELGNERSRRISFSKLLSPEEKYEFVKFRLEKVKSELKLDGNQIAIVNDIAGYLTPETFVRGSHSHNKLVEYEITWRKNALKVFTPNQLRFVFSSFQSFSEYQLSQKKSKLNLAATAGGETTTDCDCAPTSNYCNSPKSHCPSSTTTCVVDDWACGLFYLYDCTSICTA